MNGLWKMHAIALIVSVATLSGCDTKSSVDFKGARAISSTPTQTFPALAPNQGGVVGATTVSGYKVNLTLGSPNTGAASTTGANYGVQMNGQGQMQ